MDRKIVVGGEVGLSVKIDGQVGIRTTIDGQPDKVIGGSGALRTVSVTPIDEEQHITPDSGYIGFSAVTVEPIPSNYGRITWTGTSIIVS